MYSPPPWQNQFAENGNLYSSILWSHFTVGTVHYKRSWGEVFPSYISIWTQSFLPFFNTATSLIALVHSLTKPQCTVPVERVSYKKLLINIAFLCSSSCLSDLVCILSLFVRIIIEPNTLPTKKPRYNKKSMSQNQQ